MMLSGGRDYEVEYAPIPRAGTHWIVRVYRKRFLLRRRISSDWFLDEQQAKRFAEEIAAELRAGGPPHSLMSRPPGWTLHRPEPGGPDT